MGIISTSLLKRNEKIASKSQPLIVKKPGIANN